MTMSMVTRSGLSSRNRFTACTPSSAEIALGALEHDHLSLGPGGTRLEPDERTEIEDAGDPALLVHDSEDDGWSARHAGERAHLGHPAHQWQGQRVALSLVKADHRSHGHSNVKRRTTVCSSTLMLVSSWDAWAIEAVVAACSRTARKI